MVCKYCNGEFCMKCFRLEQHICVGVELKNKEQLKDLEKKLDYKPECKYAFLR